MLHISFVEIGPLVLGKSFEGCGGHLSHVTQMPQTHFCSPYSIEDPHKILALIDQAVLEKKMFEIITTTDGLRLR